MNGFREILLQNLEADWLLLDRLAGAGGLLTRFNTATPSLLAL
jgi:hypothetical protein